MFLLESVHNFLNAGGDVLWIILFVSISLWTLIAERYLYFKWSYPQHKATWLKQWLSRDDRHTRTALHIRNCLISEAKIDMAKTLPVINMLVGLCPLLGLLGTVTGMIHVFDVMSSMGTSNARAMASGVSEATIPTMAGMVIAIGGLYFSTKLEERISEEIRNFATLLNYH